MGSRKSIRRAGHKSRIGPRYEMVGGGGAGCAASGDTDLLAGWGERVNCVLSFGGTYRPETLSQHLGRK